MKNNQLYILGCGGSSGVPSVESGWGNSNKNNLKNKRSRSSAFFIINGIHILIDTTPDLREQLLSNNIKRIDYLLYTHAHADHVNGIDDLRGISRLMQRPIECYFNYFTFKLIQKNFSYVFNNNSINKGITDFTSPALVPNILTKYENFTLKVKNKESVIVVPTLQNHGTSLSTGFVFNNKIAYATDFVSLEQKALDHYKNLDILVVSAFTMKPHHCHLHLAKLIELIHELAPKKAILTHMGTNMDYDRLQAILPKNIIPAYDGLKVNF